MFRLKDIDRVWNIEIDIFLQIHVLPAACDEHGALLEITYSMFLLFSRLQVPSCSIPPQNFPASLQHAPNPMPVYSFLNA